MVCINGRNKRRSSHSLCVSFMLKKESTSRFSCHYLMKPEMKSENWYASFSLEHRIIQRRSEMESYPHCFEAKRFTNYIWILSKMWNIYYWRNQLAPKFPPCEAKFLSSVTTGDSIYMDTSCEDSSHLLIWKLEICFTEEQDCLECAREYSTTVGDEWEETENSRNDTSKSCAHCHGK